MTLDELDDLAEDVKTDLLDVCKSEKDAAMVLALAFDKLNGNKHLEMFNNGA